MKSITNVFLLAIAVMLFSCSEKETPGGVKYKVLKKGDGVKTKTGSFLVMNIELKDSRDSVWFSTTKLGAPTIIQAPDSTMEKDNTEIGVFKILTKGDCVNFQIPMKLVLTKMRREVPQGMDAESPFTFIASLQDVWTYEQTMKFQQEAMAKNIRKQFVTDSTLIADHLKGKGIEALSTPSGLRYIIQKEGKGPKAVTGKTALVHYAGYFIDGSLFDTSIASVAKEKGFDNGGRNEPYPVQVNQSSVIQAWHETLQLMNKGMKVTVYIPSGLGYGPRGRGSIPPNTVLVFDMEVTDIK